jgi:hypothetical protein
MCVVEVQPWEEEWTKRGKRLTDTTGHERGEDDPVFVLDGLARVDQDEHDIDDHECEGDPSGRDVAVALVGDRRHDWAVHDADGDRVSVVAKSRLRRGGWMYNGDERVSQIRDTFLM